MKWLKQLIENALKGKLSENVKIEEVADTITESAQKEIGKTFVPKEEFNSKNEELKASKSKLDEMQKQVSELSKTAEISEELKKKLEDTEKEFEGFKSETQKREDERKKVGAIERGLRAANAADDAIDLLIGQFELDKISLDKKGNIVDWDDHLKPVQESRKTLFGTTTTTGDKPPNPQDKGGAKTTKAQLIELYNKAEEKKDVATMLSLQSQIKQIKEE